MRYLIWGIVNIDAIMLVFLLVAAAFVLFNRLRFASHLLLIVVSVFLFTIVSPWGYYYVQSLEDRYPRLKEIPTNAKGVIIIGGMVDREISLDRDQLAFNLNGPRMSHVVRVIQMNPKKRHLIMGGGRPEIPGLQEADLLAKHLGYLKESIPKLMFDTDANTTLESARVSMERLKPKPGESWVLVTSAYHMPRAMKNFKDTGWDIIPFPTDYKTKKSHASLFNFSIFRGIMYWKIASHEYIMSILDGFDSTVSEANMQKKNEAAK